MKTTTTNYLTLTSGIVELLYQRGYNYFVSYRIEDDQENCMMRYDVSFYKREKEAQLIYNMIKNRLKFIGHVIDDGAIEMTHKAMFCQYLIRDVRY